MHSYLLLLQNNFSFKICGNKITKFWWKCFVASIFLKKWKISLFQENEGCHLWRVWHKIVTDKLFLVIPLDSATYYFLFRQLTDNFISYIIPRQHLSHSKEHFKHILIFEPKLLKIQNIFKVNWPHFSY